MGNLKRESVLESRPNILYMILSIAQGSTARPMIAAVSQANEILSDRDFVSFTLIVLSLRFHKNITANVFTKQ